MIIEDGSQIANSNSYVTRAAYIAYAATVGVTIADAVAADYELIKAAEYIDAHEANLKGCRVTREQSMAFPRYDVVIDGWSWLGTEIPTKLKQCQMEYALDVNAGIDIYNAPQNPGLITKSKRVEGAVAVTYAVGDMTGQKLTRTSKGDSYLYALLRNAGMMTLERA